MSDIFVKAFKLTESKEDLFTECLAGTLREDPRLAREFLVTLCGNQVDDVSLQSTGISIATQQVSPPKKSNGSLQLESFCSATLHESHRETSKTARLPRQLSKSRFL